MRSQLTSSIIIIIYEESARCEFKLLLPNRHYKLTLCLLMPLVLMPWSPYAAKLSTRSKADRYGPKFDGIRPGQEGVRPSGKCADDCLGNEQDHEGSIETVEGCRGRRRTRATAPLAGVGFQRNEVGGRDALGLDDGESKVLRCSFGYH